MKSIQRLALAFTCSLTLGLFGANQAQAATQRSADFSDGNTVGVGLFGLSYDYGLGPVSLGFDSNARLNTSAYSYGYGGLNTNLKFSGRTLWRVMETGTLTGAFLAAAHYDPGSIGENNSAFVPEVGFSIAYRILDSPFLIRLNTTVGYNHNLTAKIWPEPTLPGDTSSNTPREVEANFLQKFGVGPGTSFELAYQPDENSEITVGGGSLIGMRLKF